MSKTSPIQIKRLNKIYDKRSIAGIQDISFELKDKESMCIIGPSGSGKTTLLKCLAGKITDFSGEIIQSENTVLGYVAQNDQLDPNLSIFDNLAQEIQELNDEEKIENQVRSTLSLLNITNEIENLPSQISGGQYQRVLIGKALVRNPNVLMMDEPFGHLDEQLRFELMNELFFILKSQGIALIWVTHQNHEALAFSDRILIMQHGKAEAMDKPTELYFRPPNLFCAQFLGRANTIVAKYLEDKSQEIRVEFFGQKICISKPKNFKVPQYDELLLIVRASQFIQDDEGIFNGQVIHSIFLGEYFLCEVELEPSISIWMNVLNPSHAQKNNKIRFTLNTKEIHALSEI